ncbi:M48 family metalloprotease [Actinomadura sp. WMMA1423]|uniref:M48 family metalloprotease n=1 Tax=Actinomadura sp. WMMA1423 TaxID=2591108 RepID=UPI00114712E0|nr:M48 family metalloprotease [Actinomadura sp. WMMA1423]
METPAPPDLRKPRAPQPSAPRPAPARRPPSMEDRAAQVPREAASGQAPAGEPVQRYLPPGQPHGTPSGRAGVAIALVVAVEGVAVAAVAFALRSVWPPWGSVVLAAFWAALLLAPLTARRSYAYREPDDAERARVDHAWRNVQQHAGVSGYRLVIVESDALNACRPSVRTVAVTSHSARSLPPERLAAVLAHELGHLQGWHAVPAFVHAQVTLPHRVLRWALRTVWSPIGPMWKRAVEWHRPIGFLVVFLLAAVASVVTVLAAVPAALAYAASLGAGLLSAGGEARADEAAARMGFGAELVAAVEHRIEHQPDGLPLPLVRRAQALRRRLG